jgi:biopolymer transport protein ExbD
MTFPARVSDDAMSQINVTPLVDVMLVLLIIFMITAPVITHRVRVDLPQPGFRAAPEPAPGPIHLAIQANGAMYWNDAPVDELALDAQLAVAALQRTPPELRIEAADRAPYETVARVLAHAKARGLARISFADRP